MVDDRSVADHASLDASLGHVAASRLALMALARERFRNGRVPQLARSHCRPCAIPDHQQLNEAAQDLSAIAATCVHSLNSSNPACILRLAPPFPTSLR
jgi:hypothetical protein